MKNKILMMMALLSIISCDKIQEKIEETITKTTETAKEKTEDIIKETVSSISKAESAEFQEVFPDNDSVKISKFKGKKLRLPNGKQVYIFKYKADKEMLIPFLEKQKTFDENSSDKSVRKIDGKSIIDKISLIEKFIPENIVNTGFIDDIKTDENIEYYKLKRFPNSSTIIYNPKNKQIFQFVEIER